MYLFTLLDDYSHLFTIFSYCTLYNVMYKLTCILSFIFDRNVFHAFKTTFKLSREYTLLVTIRILTDCPATTSYYKILR